MKFLSDNWAAILTALAGVAACGVALVDAETGRAFGLEWDRAQFYLGIGLLAGTAGPLTHRSVGQSGVDGQ